MLREPIVMPELPEVEFHMAAGDDKPTRIDCNREGLKRLIDAMTMALEHKQPVLVPLVERHSNQSFTLQVQPVPEPEEVGRKDE